MHMNGLLMFRKIGEIFNMDGVSPRVIPPPKDDGSRRIGTELPRKET